MIDKDFAHLDNPNGFFRIGTRFSIAGGIYKRYIGEWEVCQVFASGRHWRTPDRCDFIARRIGKRGQLLSGSRNEFTIHSDAVIQRVSSGTLTVVYEPAIETPDTSEA